MKRTVLLVLAAFALSLPAIEAASARGRHKRPHAHESACQDLRGALFGLCRAYCDALHCTDSSDRRACEQLRRLYERVSKGSPPPCDEDAPTCGDGEVNQEAEECDDGNNDSCDGCSFDCGAETCGDGSVCAGEECDDGNNDSCDGCSLDCRVESCGDGTVCPDEECEPGDVCGDGQSCSDDCVCPPPPPPVFCGESPAPECGGECPPGLVCSNLGILDTCECFLF